MLHINHKGVSEVERLVNNNKSEMEGFSNDLPYISCTYGPPSDNPITINLKETIFTRNEDSA